jgi:hypothetical protein
MSFWHKIKKQRYMIGLISGIKAGAVGGLPLGINVILSLLIEEGIPELKVLLFGSLIFLFYSLLFGVIITGFLGFILSFLTNETALIQTSRVLGILIGGYFSLAWIVIFRDLYILAGLMFTFNIFWGIYASTYGVNIYLENLRRKQ